MKLIVLTHPVNAEVHEACQVTQEDRPHGKEHRSDLRSFTREWHAQLQYEQRHRNGENTVCECLEPIGGEIAAAVGVGLGHGMYDSRYFTRSM